jgi:hypothetical protein
VLIRSSARSNAGNGFLVRLSDRGGGGGSALSVGTGDILDGDGLPWPKEFAYALNNWLTTSCLDVGANSPTLRCVIVSVMVVAKRYKSTLIMNVKGSIYRAILGRMVVNKSVE